MLLERSPRLTCPFCRAELPVSTLSLPNRLQRYYAREQEVFCPACDCELLVRLHNLWTLCAAAFGAVALIGYAAGLEGIAAVGLAAAALRFGHVPIIQLSMRLFPPDVELCCDFRRILYSRDESEPPRKREPLAPDAPTADGNPPARNAVS